MNKFTRDPAITIAGAGSIGCFIGGLLIEAGHNVTFLGRKRIADELNQHGLHLTDYTGLSLSVSQDNIHMSEDPAVFCRSDLILVCTKSAATTEMAELIAAHVQPCAVIVSLQNGMRNADALRKHLPHHDVRAGMVGFNVIPTGQGRFHRGTSGEVIIEGGDPDVANLMATGRITIKSSFEITAIQSGKLLLNLNNAVNALSGLTIKEQLADRGWRRQMAEQMSEGLRVMQAAGLAPAPPTPAPAWLLPYILRLPNFIFKIAAKQMLAVDPKARSSMSGDLDQGRKTEIDEFQGEIIRLGAKTGVQTPACREIYEQIRKLEKS